MQSDFGLGKLFHNTIHKCAMIRCKNVIMRCVIKEGLLAIVHRQRGSNDDFALMNALGWQCN